ncbi:serine-rich adhesin for platelets isoform X1 [Drosophila innubila]|uniref:serine-rich adhesin for platelets isoform X1 n=1 Tax=Drosophila innubila TaxID=198719 RepID=UPI00148D0905|nr:serine-rich adhesin for platelets isoform X1 [Drosophila innubila]
MSARKPPTVAVTTTTAAATAEGTGSKPDNNNVASPTIEMEASQGDEATTTGETTATVAAGESSATTATTASGDAEQDPDKDQDRDRETDKDSNKAYHPSPLTTECGSPRKTHSDSSSLGKNLRVTRHSSPLLLLNCSGGGGGGGVSDGEELPSGSNSSQGSQRKSSADRQTLIRGRKSIKDLKEVKEAAVKLLEELNVKDATYEMDSEGTIMILPEQYVKDQKDTKDTKDTNTKSTVDGDKDLKDSKEKDKDKEKETTPTPTPVPIPTPIVQPTPTPTPTPTCNRVTRKAHAQELALANNNTRVTRNRRQSSTVNNEPQLPARGRRKRLAPPDPKEFLKRKRSDDDTELGLKYGKLEVKEEEDDHESSTTSLGADESTPAKSTISIKVELPDSEEQITVATAALTSPAGATPAAAVTPTQQSGNRRGRGRPQTKVTPSTSNSNTASSSTTTTAATTTTTSTRATRHSKAGSPGLLAAVTPTEPTPPKRRRVGSANRSLLVAKATSASSSSLATSSHGGAAVDEDSKDSLASSSMDDLLLAAAEIKQEKMTLDFDESFVDAVTKPTEPHPEPETVEHINSAEDAHASTSAASSNGIEPLTVDTDTDTCKPSGNVLGQIEEGPDQVKGPAPESEAEGDRDGEGETESNEAGKAPSLSPEMISEGVSAISVKQFYKKPEFLANNLGIEKDPELGEIVQIATEAQTSTVDGETETEKDTETDKETDVAADVEAEIEMDGGDVETKHDDSYSTGMGELRVDESGDEVDLLKQKSDSVEEAESGEAEAEESGEAATEKTETIGSPGELNGEETELQSKTDDYDDFESEIMEQLAKEGVVDASGNALSATKQIQEEPLQQLPEIECDTVKQVEEQAAVVEEEEEQNEQGEDQKQMQEQEEESESAKKLTDGDNEMMLALEVEPFTEEQEAEANAEADDDTEMQILTDDCSEYPEENKENVSTLATDDIVVVAAVSHESAMNIELAIDMKAEENVAAKLGGVKEEQKDQDDEIPLAAIAAEQKTLPNLEPTKTEANGKPMKLQDVEEDLRRQKEFHLQNLGLLTHQAAEQLRQEYIQEAHTRAVHQQQMQQQQQQQHQQQQSGKRSAAKGGGGSASHIESSGTLKTVIKLNRSSNGGAGGASGVPTGTVIHGGAGSAAGVATSNMGSATRKGGAGIGGAGGAGSSAHGVRRQSLKMTFQKGRARGHGATDRAADQHGAHGAEDSYYTIQNENEGATKTKSNLNSGNTGHGRKTNNRFSSTNNNNNNINNNSSQQQQLQQQQLKQLQQQQQQHRQQNNASRICLGVC